MTRALGLCVCVYVCLFFLREHVFFYCIVAISKAIYNRLKSDRKFRDIQFWIVIRGVYLNTIDRLITTIETLDFLKRYI